MKKMFVLMLVVAVALAIAATASAQPSKKVLRLRHQLHSMAVARNKARGQLATTRKRLAISQAQIQSLQSQLSSTSSLLAQRTTERDSALGQVASLQARLDAIPSPLAIAEQDVRREVEWAEGGGAPGTSVPLLGKNVALAAMDYTIGHVRVGAYGWYENYFGEAPGGPDLPSYELTANEILAGQAGICGHAARVFAQIVSDLGFPVRSVQFSFNDPTPDGHIAVEVFYDGAWHYFDPTFGQFWKDASGNVLGISDVRSGLGARVKDDAAFVNLIEGPALPGGDSSWYETDPATVVTVGAVSLF